MSAYRLWLNADRTVLVRQWENGLVEIATRDDPSQVWGPPVERDDLPSWINNLTEQPAR